MAQMEWNKYPEVMPPADDTYLAVVEFRSGYTGRERRVLPIQFVHDMMDIDEVIDNPEHRPCWFDFSPDFEKEELRLFELDVLYWMPFPEPPEE